MNASSSPPTRRFLDSGATSTVEALSKFLLDGHCDLRINGYPTTLIHSGGA